MNNQQRRNDLLQQIAKRHEAATKKVSRLRRMNGVEIGGTKLDPRRDLDRVRSYNAPQLRAYLNQLNQFQSRSVSYVAGAEGMPIAASTVKKYRKLESRYNQLVAQHEAAIANVRIRPNGPTVAEREARLKPENFITAGGDRGSRPFSERTRKITNVRGEAAMQKIIADMEKRMRPGYFNKRIAAQREELRKMATIMGDDELIKSADKLTNQQFNVFWNYAGGAQDVASRYGVEQMRAGGTEAEERWWAGTIEDSTLEARNLLENARQFPTTRQETQGRSRRRRR